ncbi:Translational repressor Pumilio/PUF3 and related RNA-binding proteins (Puf superfamily) protein [Dioscorea alata]|uniref:Translational repressor Pumilio/PUF3 and related RNA-binding proteins (Puf superfamily) protein n=2 Tax=Dioscorea alata TaxID=55571 RepID=A0ACB7W7T3_DIOAL|nr:Translational repressor Pumilio/PUF3 and related RNA-binding proteins (Puf superfamily) protein [Dioscorea alata]KAH7683504.1 Translational repressor Pumilio/PUF3 and related RNA-binding proteins (Puf superfamily) protein [Dioscorea alata]
MRLGKQEEGEMESLLDEIPHAININDSRHGLPMDALFGRTSVSDDSSSPIFHGWLQSHNNGYVHGDGNGNACWSSPIFSDCSSSSGEDRMLDEQRLLDGIRNISIGRQAMAASMVRSNYNNSARRSSPEMDLGASQCPLWGMEGFGSNHNVSVFSPPYQPRTAKGALQSQKNLGNLDCDVDALNSSSPRSPYDVHPKVHYSLPLVNEEARTFHGNGNGNPISWLSSIKNLCNAEDFDIESSLIMQDKGLYGPSNGRKAPQANDQLPLGGLCGVVNYGSSPRHNRSPIHPLLYERWVDVEGYISYLAKDQHGCRFLQRKFDDGKDQVDKIFNGIINNVAELMIDPFGNYLMQKLFDVCSEEQRMSVILILTKYPDELVRISLNIHGTRAVQKLIETIKTRQQKALVMSALQPGFLELIKDLNGNHVIQRCLQSLTNEDNKLIFDAAAKHCVDIATHRHGCCVLQRCIAHSVGEHRVRLVSEVSLNGLLLAQDPFGNYVVQFILELKNPSILMILASQFEGNYVQLSTQKFSSNVVEKCLKYFGEEARAKIISELLTVPRFEQLVQDPYANYVIQSALVNSKGSLRAALVEAIQPHASVLRTSPYCKRIFSRALLKK